MRERERGLVGALSPINHIGTRTQTRTQTLFHKDCSLGLVKHLSNN